MSTYVSFRSLERILRNVRLWSLIRLLGIILHCFNSLLYMLYYTRVTYRVIKGRHWFIGMEMSRATGPLLQSLPNIIISIGTRSLRRVPMGTVSLSKWSLIWHGSTLSSMTIQSLNHLIIYAQLFTRQVELLGA